VPRRKVADIQANPREACDLRHFSFAQKSIGDAALIEDFDGARVQAAGARACEILVGSRFDNGNVDTGQRQFARQHQTGRPAPAITTAWPVFWLASHGPSIDDSSGISSLRRLRFRAAVLPDEGDLEASRLHSTYQSGEGPRSSGSLRNPKRDERKRPLFLGLGGE
jgi:hypothetical protein